MGTSNSRRESSDELSGFSSYELISKLREDRQLYECCRIHPELRKHVLKEARKLYKKPKHANSTHVDYQLNNELYAIIKDFDGTRKSCRNGEGEDQCTIL